MRVFLFILMLLSPLLTQSASAETATYGAIDLTGLARADWQYNPPGESFAMVCNVNGPDGFLTIRAKPSSKSASNRKLKRLAIVTIDTSQRVGRWVRVLTAHRDHTINGQRQNYKSLHVSGWAHDGYLCGFLD